MQGYYANVKMYAQLIRRDICGGRYQVDSGPPLSRSPRFQKLRNLIQKFC